MPLAQALKAVPGLTSLSLSHNALRQLALPRGALPLLVELNVNKNVLSSLSFLEVRPQSGRPARVSWRTASDARASRCRH